LPGKGEFAVPLTVKDILEKTFKKSFKGYDEDEVDKFLDQIIDEIKALQNDNASLKEALEAEKDRAKRIRDTEETIMETLVSAQKSAKRIISEASNKAATIIDSAEATAKKRAEQTTKELADSQRRLEEIRKSAGEFAKSFTDMVSAQSAAFEKIYTNYFGEADRGINLKALEKIDMDISESLKEIQSVPETDMPEIEAEPPENLEVFSGSGEEEAEIPEPEKIEAEEQGPKLMEFTEINKALSELEEGGEDILQDNYVQAEEEDERTAGKSSYDDYSWLYDRKGEEDSDVTIRDPKRKAELESLIDDILE
jgi:cell division initiation protein